MPTVNITKEALAQFRDAVWKKHGTLRGTLQAEATEAVLKHAKTLEEAKDA